MSYNQAKRPSFSKAQRAAFIAKHGRICHWCLKPISEAEKWQVEHVIPRELMPGREADDPSNLKPIHADPCHKAKSALDIKLISKSNRIRRQADPETRRQTKHPIRSGPPNWPKRAFPQRLKHNGD
jgi:5-methylcytosine-specific restriction endonuclease McrA